MNKQTQESKHRKMERRLYRGVLRPGEKNSGEPDSSKLNPDCKWAKKRGITQ